MTLTPEQMIERVAALRHRGCDRCEDCRALVQVVALAREAIVMKAVRRFKTLERREGDPRHRVVPEYASIPQRDTLGDPLE